MTISIRYALGHAQAGAVLLACQEQKVSYIALGQDANQLASDLQAKYPPQDGQYELVKHDQTSTNYLFKLLAYLDGKVKDLSNIPIQLNQDASSWQRRVWQEILKIPYGETNTYGRLARDMGLENHYARAVGGACGKNDIAILVPCHRVVAAGKPNSLTYRWGSDWKQYLLELEQGKR